MESDNNSILQSNKAVPGRVLPPRRKDSNEPCQVGSAESRPANKHTFSYAEKDQDHTAGIVASSNLLEEPGDGFV